MPAPSDESGNAREFTEQLARRCEAAALAADPRITNSEGGDFGDRRARYAYATSHVGWGMNPGAKWVSATMYDKRDMQAVEFRALPGSFLWSTGANQYAGRYTLGHFDLPMRNCTVLLDGKAVVDKGRLIPELTA